MDELLAAIRQLPLDKRLELIERAGHEAAADCSTRRAIPKSCFDVPLSLCILSTSVSARLTAQSSSTESSRRSLPGG